MANVIAISTPDHTYMARLRGTGRVSKMFAARELLVGVNCNTLNQIKRVTSFDPPKWKKTEPITLYVDRVWKTGLAAHLTQQIDPDQAEVRFELLVAYRQHLFQIQHLPEKSFAGVSPCVSAATQYWADSDCCDLSLAATEGQDVVLRLVAAMAAGIDRKTVADITSGKRRVTVGIS
jgi:hypothetical protein